MIQEQAQRSSHCLAITVLLIILVFAVLYALAQLGATLAADYKVAITSREENGDA